MRQRSRITLQLASFSYSLLILIMLLTTQKAVANNRIALVIGNSAYPEMPLTNPRNDAASMKVALQQAGFTVVSALDADLLTMQQAMLDFVSQLDANSTALVFYAGHGMQANGRNYLLPVDAKVESERSLRFESLELTDLLEELDASNARIKMVVLDACRNNPFERKMRGSGRGLAAVDAARGTLIAYATSPGATASDGEGDNGLYTQALLENILKPGLKVEEVFKKVRIAVSEQSRGAQVPWESSSLTGDFVFIGDGDVQPVPATMQVATPTAQPVESRAVDHEALYWDSVKDSENEGLLQSYINKYPSGHFVELARLKQAAIHRGEKTEVSAASDRPKTSQIQALDGCSDLSGRWQNTPESKVTCAPKEIRFNRTGAQRYEVHGSGCATLLSGTAYHRDAQTLISSWKMATCTGTTTYRLNKDCTVAEGHVDVDRHLLCHVKDSKETLRKLAD